MRQGSPIESRNERVARRIACATAEGRTAAADAQPLAVPRLTGGSSSAEAQPYQRQVPLGVVAAELGQRRQ